MASGSSARPSNSSGSKGFDFVSDDVLFSYEDYPHQDASNGTHSDSVIATNSTKEFHKNRMTRSSMFPTSTYSPPEESSFNQDMISTVDKTIKKYTDNVMRFLEGISSRLSQLELYCYNLDKSIGEMRSDLVRDHGEADLKLKALEKHVQEVHRSVQILRDKQELAETQKELAKLQFAQKEPASASNSPQNEDRNAQPVSDSNKGDNSNDVHGQQLALALPHQVAPPAPLTNRPVEQPQQAPPPPIPSQSITLSQGYYLPPAQMSNPPAPTLLSHGQYLSTDPQYQTSQMQDLSRVPPQPAAAQGNQTQQIQSMPQYQQQWGQQVPQQVQASQQVQQHQLPTVQQQARPSSPAVYPSYPPSQPNPSPEPVPNSMPMQVSFSAIPQSVASRPEAMSYGYDRSGRPLQSQPPTQHLKPSFGAPGDGYAASGPHPSLSTGNAYLMYDGEGTRGHPQQPPNFPQSGYPPSSFPPQNVQSSPSPNLMVRPPQLMRTHPYNELIEKLASMGYRGDHVVNVIQRLEESGQTVDFNTVLDRLNGHSSGTSPTIISYLYIEKELDREKVTKMKGMQGEILLNIPAKKAWEMYRDNDKISRINPQMLTKAEYIQGNGEPGSLRCFHLGPGLSNYVKQSIEKIEKVEEGRSVTYQVTHGDLRKMYNPYRVTLSFNHVSNEQCVVEWKAEYEPIAPTIPTPEKARDAALSFLKLFGKKENHVM